MQNNHTHSKINNICKINENVSYESKQTFAYLLVIKKCVSLDESKVNTCQLNYIPTYITLSMI